MKEVGDIYDWKYEPKPFRFSKKKYKTKPFIYWPDFQVFFEKDDWVWYEVKGYLNKISKKKIERFETDYPDEELNLVQKDWFDDALKGLNKLVPNWESLS